MQSATGNLMHTSVDSAVDNQGHLASHLSHHGCDRPDPMPTAGPGGAPVTSGGWHDGEQIDGTEAELLAWLLGRSDGAALDRDKPGPLPPVPSVHYT
jgi:hypothetical protein